MYSLRAFLLIGSVSICVAPLRDKATCMAHASAIVNTIHSCASQNDNSSGSGFASKPAGSTPINTAPINTLPIKTPPAHAPNSQPNSPASGFQTKPGGQTASSNPAPQRPAISATPMSSLLQSLLVARNANTSFAQREAALTLAQSQLTSLPLADQASYAELVAASRRRLVVDMFLAGQG